MQNHSCRKLFELLVGLAAVFFCGIASAQDNKFNFSTGSPDGKLGALSRPAGRTSGAGRLSAALARSWSYARVA